MKTLTTLCGALHVLLAGCASTVDISPKLGLIGVTDAELDARFAAERVHLQGRLPMVGVALSGGGTKSAMFSYGVLHGLQQTGALQNVDAISTVSGGGYAAFWYFSHALEGQRLGMPLNAIFEDCFPYWWLDGRAEPMLKQVFVMGKEATLKAGKKSCREPRHKAAEDPFRFEAHVERWPDVFDSKITTVSGNPQKAPESQIKGLVWTAFKEIFTLWDGQESYVTTSYQEGIERTWGLNPLPRKTLPETTPENQRWAYSNVAQGRVEDTIRVNPASVQWKDLNALYKPGSQLPLWIVNTNAGQRGALPDLNHLYEITPFGHGSPDKRLPYRVGDYPQPLQSMATSMRASAAFLDGQGLEYPTLGRIVSGLSRVIPALRWGVTIDDEGTRLSDGGGVDNLGLVSLVRRGLNDIIVVDSAQDDQGRFQNLCWAQRALAQEGLTLKVDKALENFDKVCYQHFEGKQSQKLGYNVSNWKNPVIPGVVTWSGSERVTRIWLIKAGWNQNDIRKHFNLSECGYGPDTVPCGLLAFYGHNTDTKVIGEYMLFPQHTTVGDTLNASSYQIYGYREIGKMLASALRIDPKTRAVSLANSTLQKQLLYCIRKDSGRPGPGLYDSEDSEPRCPEAH